MSGSGLGAERTRLAWGRSWMALVACGAVVIKGVPRVTGSPGRPAVGLVLLGMGGLVGLAGVPYRRAAGRVRPWHLALLATGTATVGIAALVVAALFPS